MNDYPPDVEAYVKSELAALDDVAPDVGFTPAEYADRRRRLREAMTDAGVDVLVLMAPDSIAWLHGYGCRVYEWHTSTSFPPTHATVIHRSDDPVLHLDTNFHAELVRQTSCVDEFRGIPETGMSNYSDIERFSGFLVDELRAHGWGAGVVGVERWSGVPNPVVAQAYERGLRDAGYGVIDATGPIRAVRRRKSPEELAIIERAQHAADSGVRTLQQQAHEGMTELELWQLYISGMIAAGGEPAAIVDRVVAGPMDVYGHALNTRRTIGSGDCFHADVAAAHHNYHARVTRPLYVGDTPPSALSRLVEITAGTYDVLISTAEVGMPFSELNRALLSYLRDQGLSDEAGFAGGYELGLSFSPDYVGEFVWGTHDLETDAVIESGLVSNFESCGFLAMIDTVVFEESGARTLSAIPHELLLVEG